MKIAVLALTANGVMLAEKLQQFLGADVYFPDKFYHKADKHFAFQGKLHDKVGEIFDQYDGLVFIMAAGIVVRSIALLIQSKKHDPAVVVLDEKGRNVISLLSGHIGGANQLTLSIAKHLGANPVITTSSDVNETLAVDMLALQYGCSIENEQHLTTVAAAIVNNEKVAFYGDDEIDIQLGQNIQRMNHIGDIDKTFSCAVLLTVKKVPEYKIPYVILRPKSVVLGIGCRKGASEQHIWEAVQKCLQSHSICEKCIKHIATVDIKKEEEGLKNLAKTLNVPLITVDRAEIKKVESAFSCSDFVRKSIGVGCVAEPAAMLTSQNAKLLSDKHKQEGVTVAIAVEKL